MSNSTTKIDPLANYLSVTLATAHELVNDCFNAQRPVNLISSPGVGKSSLIKQICEERELLLVDVRLSTIDPTELNGFPHIWEIDGRKVASYIPMEMFPVIGTELPINPKTGNPYKGWCLFLDEFNAGTMLVQAAAYKIVLDRMVGMYELDSRCVMATAGNLASDKAIVNRLSTATQSRLVHLAIRVCNDAWHKWAAKAQIDHRVIAFLKTMPDLLHSFDPNHDDLTFPCPRTWEFMSDLFKTYEPIPMNKLPLMAGTVGKGAARAYLAHTEVYKEIPTMDALLADPLGVNFRDDPSVVYALAGMVGHNLKTSNAEQCIKFLERLGIDHQVTAMRGAVGRDYELMQHPALLKWFEKNTNELMRK